MALLDVPNPPTGMNQHQLYRWAEDLCKWLSANNFASVTATPSAYFPHLPKPDPLVFCSVNKVSAKFAVAHFRLINGSTGTRVQERRTMFMWLLPDAFHPNVGITIPNGSMPAGGINAWDFSVYITTLNTRCAWLVHLGSTGNNLVSIRHSGTQRFIFHTALYNGIAQAVGSVTF